MANLLAKVEIPGLHLPAVQNQSLGNGFPRVKTWQYQYFKDPVTMETRVNKGTVRWVNRWLYRHNFAVTSFAYQIKANDSDC